VINPQVKLRVPVSSADHAEGPTNAPLTLLEYGDYECPFCGEAYATIKDLQDALADELQFVFRNFPITQSHPRAMTAACAAEAAGLQGKFWPMHDILYENQDALEPPHLLAYADELSLDLDRFSQDLVRRDVQERVLLDFESGVRSGVNGTPTFFMNGYRYDGEYSYDAMLYALRSLGDDIEESRKTKPKPSQPRPGSRM
jgi:protein-disulfide isomerase